MTTLANILKNKGYETCKVTPETSVAECIRLMKSLNIGSVLVMDKDEIVGLFTERVAVRVIYLNLKQFNLETTAVREVMDADIVLVDPETSMEEAMELFTNKRTRHLPVLKDGKLLGVVSIGDVTKWIIEQQRNEIDHLAGYISGDTR